MAERVMMIFLRILWCFIGVFLADSCIFVLLCLNNQMTEKNTNNLANHDFLFGDKKNFIPAFTNLRVRYISFISCSPAESGSAIIIKFALISFVSSPSTYAVNPSEYGMERQRSFGEERFMVPVIRLVEKEALSLCRSRFSKTSFPRESAESAYCSIGWHTIPSSSKR